MHAIIDIKRLEMRCSNSWIALRIPWYLHNHAICYGNAGLTSPMHNKEHFSDNISSCVLSHVERLSPFLGI